MSIFIVGTSSTRLGKNPERFKKLRPEEKGRRRKSSRHRARWFLYATRYTVPDIINEAYYFRNRFTSK